MVTGLPKHITVRRAFERIRCQADAVIESIEQEATEAALALGLDVRSREKLMDALAREKGVWEWQHGGRCCSYLDDHRQSAPREDDRAVCVMMISQLITARDYRLKLSGLVGTPFDYRLRLSMYRHSLSM